MSGRCPYLAFSVSGRLVETTGDTDFDDLSCRDLEKREYEVRVTGIARADGVVDAEQVKKIGKGKGKNNDDDDDD